MKKLINLLICAILSHLTVSAQITYNPSVQSQNNRGKILSVNITNNETIIKIQFPKGGTHSISSATVLVPCDAWDISDARRSDLAWPPAEQALVSASLYAKNRQIVEEGRMALNNDGFLIRSLGNDKLDTYYKPARGADYMVLELHFDKLNPGEDNVYIREIIGDTGYEWFGIKINNPFPTTPTTGYNEFSIKQKINEQNDGIVGIYEQIGENNYKLGCIKDSDKYKLVYLGSSEKFKQWRIGDVKSVLHFTATPHLFKADYYMLDKTREEVYVVFDGQSMKITFEDGSSSAYLKMYPTTSPSGNNTSEESADWSGSGFALSNGYICTNYHVIDGAKSIEIHGVQGDFTTSYSAKVIACDKFNDLAILKVDDADFKGFGTIPYKVKTSMADVGEEIFVLGYPLTTTMGDEIKLTTGVVSSRTGYQGDVSLYQISAPIQPGNSGGPLFDSQGNLIGIVSAKHTGAENVGYAIKASYLRNLMESSLTEDVLPVNNSVSSLPLTEKVKKVKKFVYFIECNSNDFLSETNKKDVLPIDETPENESQNGEIIIEHPNKESTTSYGKYGQDSASCVKYLAYYKAYYKQKNHNNAYSYWKEAFNACPPYANQTMLIDGTSLLRTEIKEAKDGREKEKLINQLLILHDLRAEYFPKYSIVARNNKSLDAINYIEDDKRLFDILCPIIAANKANINPVVLLFYLNAAINLFHDNSISNEDINSVINTVNELATSIRPKTEQDYNTIMEIRQNIEKLLHTL